MFSQSLNHYNLIVYFSILILITGCSTKCFKPTTHEGISCVHEIDIERTECLNNASNSKSQCIEERRCEGKEKYDQAMERYYKDKDEAEKRYQDELSKWEKQYRILNIKYKNCIQYNEQERNRTKWKNCSEFESRTRRPDKKIVWLPVIDDFIDEEWCKEQYKRDTGNCQSHYDNQFKDCGGWCETRWIWKW